MLNLGLRVHRIVKLTYQSGAFVENHKHEYYHYIYVVSGSGEFEINRQRYNAAAGILYMIPQNTVHGIYCGKDLTTINIKFTCNQSSVQMLNELAHYVNNFSLHEENIIRGMLSEAVGGESLFEEVINIRFTELMLRILRRKPSGSAESNAVSFDDVCLRNEHANMDLVEVLDYIGTHLEQSICINDLAQQFGYSESYFCTIFKKVYGISPNKYINQVKINKAKDLMLYSKLNITEIAEMLGYDNIHYFSRLFKKITGVSPQHYTKKLNEDIVVNVNHKSVFIPATKYEHPAMPLAK